MEIEWGRVDKLREMTLASGHPDEPIAGCEAGRRDVLEEGGE